MFLPLIDRAIASYDDTASSADKARLQFFRALWGVQDSCMAPVPADYTMASPQALKAWNAAGESVLSHKPVPVSAPTLAAACAALANCLAGQGALPEAITGALQQAPWESLVESADSALAGQDPTAFLDAMEQAALDHVSPDAAYHVAMVASLALRTQLEAPAKAIYDAMLVAEADMPRPLKCPVCGCAPTLARVGLTRSKNGRAKELWCSQCGTAWEFERVRCGRCGTQHQGHLHYFSLEGDDSHRLQTCDECGNYLRTVFQGEQAVSFSYEVEDVVMAKLDQVAYNQAVSQQS
ncbi:MAG: formate dehydrogenase accessory protein FdhE [Coriobacteriia bacterium]|nr:formate dehydrogenase accessory protein FdhE [Coriobacteriia bacterium]